MRGLVVLLALVVGLGLVGVLPAHAAPTPKVQVQAVSLRLNDLPTGFTVDSTTYRSGGSSGLIEQDTDYGRPGLVGIIDVQVEIILQASAAKATTWFNNLTTARTLPKGAQLMSVGTVGQHRVGFRIVKKSAGTTLEGDAIVYTRGPYFVIAVGTGIQSTFSADQVLNLARIIDGRILQQLK